MQNNFSNVLSKLLLLLLLVLTTFLRKNLKLLCHYIVFIFKQKTLGFNVAENVISITNDDLNTEMKKE